MDILITLCAIAAAVTAARAFSRTRVLAANMEALKDRLDVLDRRLPALDGEPAGAPQPMPAAMPPPEIAHDAPQEAPEGVPAPAVLQPADRLAGRRWEEILVENWLVWLGGLALALGGAFLVKLSIDHGLLTAAVRVALGILLGIGLWGGAAWLAWGEPADRRPSNVCQALAAAGAVTIFASLYAAYQLYEILPPGLAFPLLALTCAATVLMSLQHGPFVAALGLTGAFAVPLLVGDENGSALPLFAYLSLVSAGSLAVLRHRAWWWLAWVWLAGSIGWALLWLEAAYRPGDVWTLGAYLLAQLGLFAALRRGIARAPLMAGVIDAPTVRIVVRSAFWALSFVVLLLVGRDGNSAASLGCSFAAVIAQLWLAYRDGELDDVMAAAGFLAAALLAGWNLPLPGQEPLRLLHNVPPEQVGRFLSVAIRFGALWGQRISRGDERCSAEPVGRAVGSGATGHPRHRPLADRVFRGRYRLDGDRARPRRPPIGCRRMGGKAPGRHGAE